MTVVVAVALLFAVFASGAPVTVAVFVSVPAAVGVTTIVIVAPAPLWRSGMLQATVPEEPIGGPEQLPEVVVTRWKRTFGGSVSTTCTFLTRSAVPLTGGTLRTLIV
ncbi:MAG: hypothetical protein M3337_02595 [Actinomycetota bacterium]|nr:hypothetical protein [Actinomycetota bacterium]